MRTLITIILALIVAVSLLYVVSANAHSWYDQQCCNMRDCEPISIEAVTETKSGWTVDYISKLGFPVHGVTPYGKERDSQDGRFHACAMPGRFLCLYVPRNV